MATVSMLSVFVYLIGSQIKFFLIEEDKIFKRSYSEKTSEFIEIISITCWILCSQEHEFENANLAKCLASSDVTEKNFSQF